MQLFPWPGRLRQFVSIMRSDLSGQRKSGIAIKKPLHKRQFFHYVQQHKTYIKFF